MSKPVETRLEDKEMVGSTGSGDVFHEQNVRRSKRSRVMGICKKFWWAFLIVLIIVVLAVVLPLVFVGFPNIIQGKLDDAEVSVEGLRITQPTGESVHMEMNSTITSGGGIHATLGSFNASLYLEDRAGHVPFAYLQMPQTSSDKLVTVNISQKLDIWNVVEYTAFNTFFLMNESFRVTIDGNTKVHVKGLRDTTANFHKTVTLKGLNALKGLNVTDFTVSLTPDSNGDNLKGHAIISNPSVLTVELGNTTFSNLFNGTKIGQLFIDNMTLYPGPNPVAIRANVSQAPILTALTTQPYCESGILPFQLLGETVISNGVHLPYYETGFKENLQDVSLDVGAALAKTLGNSLSCAN